MAESGVTTAGGYLEQRERARLADRVRQVLLLLAAAAAIFAASRLLHSVNRQRSEIQLGVGSDVFRDLPPDIAMLSTTLGPLRGLLISTLWIQADKLKEEGRFYDALQRAQWICKLQPRFASVWEFQSWNMAYNISVTRHTPEERWHWVRNGLDLVTRQGIPLNPYDVALYKQAAWILFHKMGDVMDDMHWTYRREWAAEWERLLGGPEIWVHPEQVRELIRSIAEAPQTLAELRKSDEAIGPLIGDVERLGYSLDAEFLAAVHDARFRWKRAALRADTDPGVLDADAALLAVVDEEARAETVDRLLAFVRARELRETYRMDPAFMQKLTELYGPFDWRTPYAHALYWSKLGSEMVKDLAHKDESAELGCDRIMLFSLKGLFQLGRVMFVLDLNDANRSFLAQFSNLDLIEPLHQAYIEFGEKHDPEVKGTGRAGYWLTSGHINTMHEAIRMLWIRGTVYPADRKRAEDYFSYLREKYREQDGSYKLEYRRPLRDWVMAEIKEMAQRSKPVVELLSSFFEAQYLALAQGKGDEARAYEVWAKQVYDVYMEDKADAPTERMGLLPFDTYRNVAAAQFMAYAPLPGVYKARVWDALSIPIRQAVYDMALPVLRAQCEAEELDLTKAFPEPPGMPAYRIANPKPLPDLYIPESVPEPETDEPKPELRIHPF